MSIRLPKFYLKKIIEYIVRYRVELSTAVIVVTLVLLSVLSRVEVARIHYCTTSQSVSLVYITINIVCSNGRIGQIVVDYCPSINLSLAIALTLLYIAYRILILTGLVRANTRSTAIHKIISNILLIFGIILLLPLPETLIVPNATKHYMFVPVIAAPLSAMFEILSISTLIFGEFILAKGHEKVSEVLVSLDLLLEETPPEE